MRLVTCAVIAMLGKPAHADFRFAIANDVFTAADPIGSDDNGFTNDLDLWFWRPRGDYVLGVRLWDRWVTEEIPFGGRRRDLVELLATGERTWWNRLTVTGRAGPVFTGNLGGRWMQDRFHRTCGCGRPLTEGLQNRYERGNDAGVMAGGHAVLSTDAGGWVAAYALADAQGAVGTGVSSIEGGTGGRIERRAGRTRLGGHVEVVADRFHVDDDRLAIPGGYRPGWHGAWRAGVHVARDRVRVEFEYRSQEDGSGQPIGILAFTIKQAGTRF